MTPILAFPLSTCQSEAADRDGEGGDKPPGFLKLRGFFVNGQNLTAPITIGGRTCQS